MTSEPVPPASTGADTWRFACPEGHRSLRNRASGGYYYRTCEQVYPGQPRDLQQEGSA